MTKYFVLRPHALLSSYDSTLRFGEDNVVVVPMAVIDEISNMRDLSIEKNKIKRRILEYISSFDYHELTTVGVKQKNGSILKVATNFHDINANVSNVTDFQKRTLQICLGIKKETKKQVILVTNNIALQLKAKGLGIMAEKFKDEVFPVLEEQYTGRIEAYVCDEVKDAIYSKGYVHISDVYEYENYKWYQNCFVILKCNHQNIYGKVVDDTIVRLSAHNKTPYGIRPMNDGQRLLMNALYDESPLTVVKGSAGTGKTLLSMAVGLEGCDLHKYNKILITRNVDNGKLGFLPGTVEEKVDPFLRGIKDNLDIIINGSSNKNKDKQNSNNDCEQEHGEYFFEMGTIKIEALEMLRGRSITNTCFIIDEAQNIEPEFIKTIVTRAAEGSKFILLGDPTQIDNPKLNERYNGLVYIAEKMKDNKICTVVTLNDEESVRSELAKIASEIL